jgi:hypothetical protein
VITRWYWPAVLLIYCGFAVLAADLWLEPDLRRKLWWKIFGSLVIFSFGAAFTFGFVWISAPLPISDFASNGDYPKGQKIADIPWQNEFTELDVFIENPTSRPYEDFNIVLRPDAPIVAIKQDGKACDASIEEVNGGTIKQALISANRTIKQNPLVLLATDAGYRVRCDHLPPKSRMKLVIALADIRWNPRKPTTPQPDGGIFDADYIIRQRIKDFSTYWLGHSGADVYIPFTSSQFLHVSGEYTSMYRRREISEDVNINSIFP